MCVLTEQVVKLGEGTYGEAFKSGQVCMCVHVCVCVEHRPRPKLGSEPTHYCTVQQA